MTQTAFACTGPVGVAGEVIFNSDHKVLQYCDGDDWIGMGWQGQHINAAGFSGQLQHKGSDGKLVGGGGFWNDEAKKFGFYTDDPKETFSIANSLNFHTAGHLALFFNAYWTPETSEHYAGHNGDSRYAGSVSFNPTIGSVIFKFSPVTGAKDTTMSFPVKFELTKDGRFGINKSSPAYTLDVNGDVKIQPGNPLQLDVLRAIATITSGVITIAPSNGITCSNNASEFSTTCTCPSGYMALSGGGHATDAGTHLRVNHSTALNSWTMSCKNASNTAIYCASATLSCIRIAAN